MTEFQDKTIKCIYCSIEFIFFKREQEFYKEHGFDNEPKRCKECCEKRKVEKRNFDDKREI